METCQRKSEREPSAPLVLPPPPPPLPLTSLRKAHHADEETTRSARCLGSCTARWIPFLSFPSVTNFIHKPCTVTSVCHQYRATSVPGASAFLCTSRRRFSFPTERTVAL
ncbi:hypothetical protein Mapa_004453 [Marchantia paleacea]|nr:hypothetical protein Mapa_004453 [Marchantia paleacea]